MRRELEILAAQSALVGMMIVGLLVGGITLSGVLASPIIAAVLIGAIGVFYVITRIENIVARYSR